MGFTIGVITVRRSNYHPNRRLAEAAAAMGHSLVSIHPYRLWPWLLHPSGTRGGNASLIKKPQSGWPHVFLPRQGADVGNSCLALIRQCELMQIPVINDFEAIRISRHQFYTLQALQDAGLPCPESIFVNSEEGFIESINVLGGLPVVVKQVSRRQGDGVTKVETASEMKVIMHDHLKAPQQERQGLVVQRYLPAKGRRDIRVLVVGQKAIASQELTPKKGDFRANVHLGGKGDRFTLTSALRNLAVKATRAAKLEIAGVDIMISPNGNPLIGEINYSPGFRSLEATTGFDIAAKIVAYVVKRIEKMEKPR